jgi:hypothetical protein
LQIPQKTAKEEIQRCQRVSARHFPSLRKSL